MRTQQLRSAEAALICHLLVAGGQVVAASGASDLSDGQIAGVVIGSVGGALLLGLLTFFMCCLRASRRRQTGDLTWAKSADVEVAAISQTPHQPLSGPCADDLAESARRATAAAGGGPNADASFHNVCRTDASTVTGEGQSATTFEVGGGVDLTNLPPSPLDGSGGSSRKMGGFFRGRGQGGGGGNVAQFFVVPKGLLRNHNGGPKDKHLQVSRSARVEPSAELEMAEPFQPAATNMGPPLSKSSMLLRWLNGADEGLPETAAAAAQAAAAADGASGRRGGKGATARGAGGGSRGGGGAAGLGTSLDRLPLLSLAAQQTGIVWSKMPPSVASSPAVSVVESSSMFMLKGTQKRSDALEDTASSAVHGHSQTLSHAAAALAAWHGGDGDDRYPASLAQASLQSFNESGVQRHGDGGSTAAVAAGSAGSGGGTGGGRVGIVFDYVMRRGGGGPGSSGSRTTTTAGGASSRAPTIGGGAVLTVSSSGGGADPNAPNLGFGADDAFMMGALPDENMLAQAQALNRTSPRPWLHQTPPTKLTALQEADEGEEAAPAPQPSPAPSSKQLVASVVMLSPSPMAAGRPPAPAAPVTPLQMTHGSAQVASPGWTHFGDGEASPAMVAGAAAAVAARGLQGLLASDPPASSRLSPEPPLPVSTIAAVAAAGNGQFAFGSTATAAGDGSAYSRSSASELPVGNFIGGLPDVEGVAAAGGDGGGGDMFRTPGGRLPAAAAPPPVSPSASPQASSSHLLGRRGAAPSPLQLQACQSSASLRSQTSLASPSMGLHYPDLTPEAFGSQRQGRGAVGSISEATDSAAPLSGNSGSPGARAV